MRPDIDKIERHVLRHVHACRTLPSELASVFAYVRSLEQKAVSQTVKPTLYINGLAASVATKLAEDG